MKYKTLGKENSFNRHMTERKMDEYVSYVLGGVAKPNWAVDAKEKPCPKIVIGAIISPQRIYGEVSALNGGFVVELEVLNRFGIHSRPAALIVGSACRYDAEIKMFTLVDTLGVDAKRILDVMTGGYAKGALLRVEATGEGAKESLDKLVEMFKNKFGEE